MTEGEDLVLYEREPPIGRLVLNWPEKANAQSSALVHLFDRYLGEIDRDYEIKVVIIKANGKGFSAGHVIAPGAYPEFAEGQAHIGTNWKASADLFLWPTLRLWELSKPTIAQVHGYAIGGGTYFALVPDITIASEDAYFQMPLVQGLGFPGGETMIEPWLFMNWKRAAEYLYTAQTLSAEDALRAGLINRVVPRDELEATVEQMAAHIARAPLSTLMATRALLKRAWELMGMRLHLQMSTDLMALCESTSDARALRQELAEARRLPRDQAAQGGSPPS